MMKHLEAELGKMKLPDEEDITLPGDEIIPDTKYSITHQVAIEAPVSIVWRYLMQLGCDRAGWYSIDLLDHDGIPSVDYLRPEWTDRQSGDRISATLTQDSFFEVYQVEKEKHFVIGGVSEKAHGILSPFKMTWAFVLEPIGEDATRLIVRAKMKSSPVWAEWLAGNLIYPPVHGLMSGVQLKTIKHSGAGCALANGRAMAEIA
ncbi:MAG: SRPBCC family protein [Saprospiraceae bacterium]|nr:SRPBCC family protein [Saprospiraceae bacterium]